MSDSNQPAPNTVANSAPPQPKSFTQRFQEMEQLLQKLQYVVQFHSSVVQTFVEEIKSQSDNIDAVRETINAMIKLSDEGKFVTTANIVNKITEIQADTYRKALDKELADGKIKATDQVSSGDTIISFSTGDIVFGYNAVSAFADEETKKNLLAGAKVGDQVGIVKVLGLFEVVTAPPPGEPNGQQAPEAK